MSLLIEGHITEILSKRQCILTAGSCVMDVLVSELLVYEIFPRIVGGMIAPIWMALSRSDDVLACYRRTWATEYRCFHRTGGRLNSGASVRLSVYHIAWICCSSGVGMKGLLFVWVIKAYVLFWRILQNCLPILASRYVGVQYGSN